MAISATVLIIDGFDSGSGHQKQSMLNQSSAYVVFDYPVRQEKPASCKQGSRYYSLGAACPERSEDFGLPSGSPLCGYVEPAACALDIPLKLFQGDQENAI